MEPEVRYCTTEDGASISYSTMGDGPPLVRAAGIPSHLAAEFLLPRFAGQTGMYAAECRIVRYDGRGTGLSQREPLDFSLDARVRDLRSVVDHLGLDQFALIAYAHAGLPAMAFAAAYPERVSKLALIAPFSGGEKLYRSSSAFNAYLALESVTREQWDFFVMTVSQRNSGYDDPQAAHGYATYFKAGMTAESLIAYRPANRETSVLDVLPKITAPTLVIATIPDVVPTELSREVAARIKDARFQPMEHNNWFRDDLIVERVLDFVKPERVHPASAPAPAMAPAAGTTIILFADVVDSTALTERMGDAAFRERARALDDALRGAITGAGGAAVDGKLLGDGVLATFSAASQAIDAALRCAAAGADGGLPLHVGIHAGDVIREKDNVYGGAVNIASRISALAAPGEVLVSRTVADLARTSAGVTFEDRGEHALKGVTDPQRIYAVRREN